jgi:Flp pilus assembly protein TadD
VLTTTTLAHNTIYRGEVALWEDTVAKSPSKARVWNNLGYACQLQGREQDAVRAGCERSDALSERGNDEIFDLPLQP